MESPLIKRKQILGKTFQHEKSNVAQKAQQR